MNYFSFALRNLHRKGIRTWLTLLGICIGIAAVVSLISLGGGLKVAVTSQFGVSTMDIITVQASGINYGPPGSGAVTPLTVSDAEAIERLGNVKLAAKQNVRTVKFEYKDVIYFTYLASIGDGDYRDFRYEESKIEPILGRLLKDGDTGKVVLGYNFYATDKGWGEKKLIPGKTVLIQNQSFEVVGIRKKEGSFILDNLVLINERDMEDLIGYGDEVDLIDVQPVSEDAQDKAKEDIEKLMRRRRDVDVGQEDFTISTPQADLNTINSVLSAIQVFIVIIASISIIIGIVGIVNTMTTSVLERRKEIGIMKSIGARNSQIFVQFFIESGLLGLIGGAVGIILGISLGYFGTIAINNFLGVDTQPEINFFLIFSALFGSFSIGALAGIFPAMKAAKQNPIHALREE